MISTVIIGFDRALRTLSGVARSSRPMPGHDLPDTPMSEPERRLAAGLMRVNHTGEVCAQALYSAQAAVARDPTIAARFAGAAREEEDHLAWTQSRLAELGDRTSLLNPLWYAGSFAIGAVAGLVGDRVNLGFVVETERQVEAHLQEHLQTLPEADGRSRAILRTMKDDEARHAEHAEATGAKILPQPIPRVMALASKLMKSVAYRV